MWKTISIFLLGAMAAFVAFFKMKAPDVTNVSGDLIEEQKVKDNRKIKGNTSSESSSRRPLIFRKSG